MSDGWEKLIDSLVAGGQMGASAATWRLTAVKFAQEIKGLRADNAALVAACVRAEGLIAEVARLLTVPAAEYVPAIADAWDKLGEASLVIGSAIAVAEQSRTTVQSTPEPGGAL